MNSRHRAALGLIVRLTLLASAVPAVAAESPELFEIASAHTNVSFAVGFMGLTRVKGQFDRVAGALSFDPAHPDRSSGTIDVDVTSLHTGNDARDRHLLSDDFFDGTKFPNAMFRSDSIQRVGEEYRAAGHLTLHGVTHPLTLVLVALHDDVVEREGVRYVNYEGTARVPWREFGLAGTGVHNSWFKPATMAIADTVVITLEVQASRRNLAVIHYPRLENAISRLTTPNLSDAFARYRRLRAASPDSVAAVDAALVDAGFALIDRGRPEDGVRVLALNAEIHGNDASAHAALAQGLDWLGRHAEAKGECAKALQLDPDDPVANELNRRFQRGQ
jgi:polyisoprenoid-binding protein YceI